MKKKFTLFCFLIPVLISAQKPITLINQEWENNQWQDVTRITNTYDTNDYLTTSLEEEWDKPSTIWKNGYLINFTNNVSGKVLEYLMKVWDVPSTDWKNSLKGNSTYTNNELETLIISQWLSDAWINSLKTIFTYDNDGNLINELNQIWKTETQSWENSTRTTYDYLSGGLIEQTIDQMWDADLNEWVNYMRNNHTYADSKLESVVQQMWTGADWMNFVKNSYTYDANGRELTQLEAGWNFISAQWEPKDLTTNTYDNVGNPIEKLHQIWMNLTWVNSQRTVLTYAGSTSTENIEKAWIRLYPNPTMDYFTIQSSGIESTGTYRVVALDGETIEKGKLQGFSTKVNLGCFPAGIYMVEIEIANQKTIRKMVKK